MEDGKRKRDTLEPRVTYHADNRTFARLFKEQSLRETKEVVRQKLGLSTDTIIHLAQLCEGKTLDLEDDDDFDAFYVLAHSTSSVDVRVTVLSSSSTPGVADRTVSYKDHVPAPPTYHREQDEVTSTQYPAETSGSLPLLSPSSPRLPSSPRAKRKVANPTHTASSPTHAQAKPKKRKGNLGGAVDVIEPQASEQLSAVEVSQTNEPQVQKKSNDVEVPVAGPSSAKGSNPLSKKNQKKAVIPIGDQVVHPIAGPSTAPAPKPKSTRTKKLVAAQTKNVIIEAPSAGSSKPATEKGKKSAKSKQAAKSPEFVESDDSSDDTPSKAIVHAVAPDSTRSRSKSETQRKVEGSVIPKEPVITIAIPQPETIVDQGRGIKKAAGKRAETSEVKAVSPLHEEQPVPTDAAPENLHGSNASLKPTRKRKPDPNGGEDEGPAKKKTKGKQKVSTNHDVEAAEADILAAISTVMTSKALSAHPSGTSVVGTRQVEMKSKPPTRKSNLKSQVPDGDEASTHSRHSPINESPRDPPTEPLLPIPTKGKKSAVSQKPRNQSSDTRCPICLQAPLHLYSVCPVVRAGPKAIENRLLSLPQEDSQDHLHMIDQLEKRIKNARSEEVGMDPTVRKYSDTGSFPASSTLLGAGTHILKTSTEPNRPTTRARDSGPRIPYGSRPSEVTIESKDEGSSNDSSSEESSGESDHLDLQLVSGNRRRIEVSTAEMSFTDVDLDSLVRGPMLPRRSIADILSDTIEPVHESTNEVVLEEDEEPKLPHPRQAKRNRIVSSSDEDEDEDEDQHISQEVSIEESDHLVIARSQGAKVNLQDNLHDDNTDSALRNSEDHVSFQAVNGLADSIEIDRTGDAAFSDALAADTSVLDLARGETDGAAVSPPTKEKTAEGSFCLPGVLSPTSGRSKTPLHEDDPIEPADDLLELLPEASPIEANPNENHTRMDDLFKQSTPSQMIHRMKDRHGQLPDDGEVPVPPTGRKTRASKRNSFATSTPAPLLDPVIPPKTRRSRKTETEKAAEVAAKLAAKEEKEKEKLRLRQEKALTRAKKQAAAKNNKVSRPRAEFSAKSAPEEHAGPVTTSGVPAADRFDSLKVIDESLTQKSSGNALPPSPLNHWATLPPSSPHFEPDSSVMIDQLRSSSPPQGILPNDQRKGKSKLDLIQAEKPQYEDENPDSADAALQPDPLFLHSASQVPFPFSQWNAIIRPQGMGSQPGHASDSDSEDEAAVQKAVQPPAKFSTSAFRKLTDIASQRALFSSPSLHPTTFPSAEGSRNKLDELYGKRNMEEEEEDEENDSDDSDAEDKSHIPKSRRAGMLAK